MNRRHSPWVMAFGCALRGIAVSVLAERNMRFHIAAAAAVAVAGIWLHISLAGWLWLGAATAAVLTAELINTAVERTVDLVSPQTHPLAKEAKDAAAGAVLVAAAFAACVGLAVLGPPLWHAITG